MFDKPAAWIFFFFFLLFCIFDIWVSVEGCISFYVDRTSKIKLVFFFSLTKETLLLLRKCTQNSIFTPLFRFLQHGSLTARTKPKLKSFRASRWLNLTQKWTITWKIFWPLRSSSTDWLSVAHDLDLRKRRMTIHLHFPRVLPLRFPPHRPLCAERYWTVHNIVTRPCCLCRRENTFIGRTSR